MNLKVCKRCTKELPRDSFYKLSGTQYKTTWDCRDSLCISCRTDYQTERRRNIKETCVKFLGGKCIDCRRESTYYSIYDFHHESGKDFSISDKGGASFLKLKKELEKCVLLCACCHRIRHEKQGQK